MDWRCEADEARPASKKRVLLCSLAAIVEASHMTICYTIAVYMVLNFLTGADEATVGTLTGLLVRVQHP